MTISLILPYWDRQDAADRALTLLDKQYGDLELEVVVVDDGNPVPFHTPPVGLTVNVVRLPQKPGPKCPCTAWNAGVKASAGEIIVLSCIEVLHTEPVLEQMAYHVENMGPKGYVLAAAWCPEQRAWHCHSTVSVPDCPPGSGIAFCAAMHRDLFFQAGGFGEEYRDGAGYEDRDFIRRLHKVGAKFQIHDELQVIHPKGGATIKWPEGSFERNEILYRRSWPC